MEAATETQVGDDERVKAAIRSHDLILKEKIQKLKRRGTNPNLAAISLKENKAYNEAISDCIRVIEYSGPSA